MGRSAAGSRLIAAAALLLALASLARAGDDVEERIRRLEDRIRAQDAEIRELRREVREAAGETDPLGAEIDAYLGKESDEGWFSEPGTLRAFWKNGLRFESPDHAFEMEVGGRVNVDLVWFDADSAMEDRYGEFPDQAGIRRGRLLLAGRVYRNVLFKAEYDFAKGDVSFADVIIAVTGIPLLGTVSVGHQKEPFSLEWQTSGKFITFMERGLPNALVPARSVGISAANDALDGRLSFGIGVFSHPAEGRGSTPGNVTARVAGIPWRDEEAARFVTVGASLSLRDAEDGEARFRERPEVNFTDNRVVDTGVFAADGETRFGLESAAVWGPFSLQGEYVWIAMDAPAVGDPTFSGFYLYGSWFVTGESRRVKGLAFSRVSPTHDLLGDDGGLGAVELALRYSRLDLADAGVDGGEVSDWTFALNWYLNPNTRVRMNYVLCDPDGSGSLGILMFRVEVEF